MGPNEILDKGQIADGPVPMFHAVRLGTEVDHVLPIGTAGQFAVGIAQENIDEVDVARGRVLRVRTHGISRAVATAAIARNQLVSVAADGRVRPAQTGDWVVGFCTAPSGQADDWCNVFLTPGVRAQA